MFSFSWLCKLLNFRLREHIQGVDNNPLLIFPEGTCVNNQYSVMFKKVYLLVFGANCLSCSFLMLPTFFNFLVSLMMFRVHSNLVAQFARLQSSTIKFLLMHFGIVGSKQLITECSTVPTHNYKMICIFCHYWCLILQFVIPVVSYQYHIFLQAVLHNASVAAYDILGCCLWCVVPRAPKSKTWRNTDWICREVSTFLN